MTIWRRVACAVLLLVLGVSLCANLWPRLVMPGNIARPRMRPLRASTGLVPTTSAVIALPGCSMEPGSPCCLLPQPLCFQL